MTNEPTSAELAERVERAVEWLANTQMGMSLHDWAGIATTLLAARDRLRSDPPVDEQGVVWLDEATEITPEHMAAIRKWANPDDPTTVRARALEGAAQICERYIESIGAAPCSSIHSALSGSAQAIRALGKAPS